VLTVCLNIHDVVDQVNDAGDQAKQGKSSQGVQKSRRDHELFVEYERKEDKGIFCPLTRTHAFKEGTKHDVILPYGIQVGGLKVELDLRSLTGLQGVDGEI
jgi:hypothetical protein